MPFASLGLTADLLSALAHMGYETPTPIQQQAIPLVLQGRDVVGCAQTGTGKTAAFMLPTLQRVPAKGGTRALVVTPTRELASQIEEVGRECAEHTGHNVTAVYGGVRYDRQQKRLKNGVDVLVATPGRLLDAANRRDVDLSQVEILVLDEADRMLDMGFWPDVRRIIQMVPTKRQNLLFSATMGSKVLDVIRHTLTDPIRVEVGAVSTPVDAIDQKLYPVDNSQKIDLLIALLEKQHLERVIVFTSTKVRADRVQRVLERKGVSAEVMHADRSQGQRQAALDGFKSGKHRVLVATDIVARGIDVDEVSHVINYDVPGNPEDYVHRIGRTGRAGSTGEAITLLSIEDAPQLREIERLIGRVLPCEDLEDFTYRERFVPRPDRDKNVNKPRTVFRSMGRRGRIGRR